MACFFVDITFSLQKQLASLACTCEEVKEQILGVGPPLLWCRFQGARVEGLGPYSPAKGWTSSGLNAITLAFDLDSELLSTSGGKEEADWSLCSEKLWFCYSPKCPRSLIHFLLRSVFAESLGLFCIEAVLVSSCFPLCLSHSVIPQERSPPACPILLFPSWLIVLVQWDIILLLYFS